MAWLQLIYMLTNRSIDLLYAMLVYKLGLNSLQYYINADYENKPFTYKCFMFLNVTNRYTTLFSLVIQVSMYLVFTSSYASFINYDNHSHMNVSRQCTVVIHHCAQISNQYASQWPGCTSTPLSRRTLYEWRNVAHVWATGFVHLGDAFSMSENDVRACRFDYYYRILSRCSTRSYFSSICSVQFSPTVQNQKQV